MKALSKFKSVALAVAALAGFAVQPAQAAGLYVGIQKSVQFTGNYNPAPSGVTADYDTLWNLSSPTAWFGTIMASSPGTVTATYLGQESGYLNSYSLDFFSNMLLETDKVGKSVTANVTSTVMPFALDFSFNTKASNGYVEKVSNGQVFSKLSPSFAILGDYLQQQSAKIKVGKDRNGKTIYETRTFDYILGFNDSWIGDADFDDFVVGINFAPTPVPLPAAAWLFGSALLGFITISNRRKV